VTSSHLHDPLQRHRPIRPHGLQPAARGCGAALSSRRAST
jgi:hypothetical protein